MFGFGKKRCEFRTDCPVYKPGSNRCEKYHKIYSGLDDLECYRRAKRENEHFKKIQKQGDLEEKSEECK